MNLLEKFINPEIQRLVGFYHKDCLDGSFSAAFLQLFFEHTEQPYVLIPTAYGDDIISQVKPGDLVVFADMSTDPEQLKTIASYCVSVLVLDHHDTAVRAYDALPSDYFDGLDVILYFDQSRCGAKLVYEELEIAKLINDTSTHLDSVIDRVNSIDLQLPEATEHDCLIFGSYAKTYLTNPDKVYLFIKEYMTRYKNSIESDITERGTALYDSENEQVQWSIENTLRTIELDLPDGASLPNVALVNAPKYLATRISRVLEDTFSCILIYHDTPEGRTYRIASKRGGLIVNTIAESFGGGGHPHSAGIVASKNSYLGQL